MQLPVSQLIPPGKYIQRKKRKCLKKEEEEEEAEKFPFLSRFGGFLKNSAVRTAFKKRTRTRFAQRPAAEVENLNFKGTNKYWIGSHPKENVWCEIYVVYFTDDRYHNNNNINSSDLSKT